MTADTPREPVTEAGRSLNKWAESDARSLPEFEPKGQRWNRVRDAILAIEAEARAAGLREAAARIAELPPVITPQGERYDLADRDEVLALLAAPGADPAEPATEGEAG